MNDFFSATVTVHAWVYYLAIIVMCLNVAVSIMNLRNVKKKEGKLNA